MSDFDQTGVQLEQRPRRPGASRLADRLARTFGGFDRTQEELPGWEDPGDVEYPITGEHGVPFDAEHDRFRVTRHGYDRDAVDRHVAELEREITVLRESGPAADAVAREIDRFGEQTAAILKVAHEQAFETRRTAQAEADRCLADAAQNALAITDDAQRKLRQLDTETDQVWQERGRLIEDVRAVATALLSLANEAAERFPPEQEKPQQSTQGPPQQPTQGFAPQPIQALAQQPTQALPPQLRTEDDDDGYAGLA